MFTLGELDSGGHVLRETTSRGLCGQVCPSPTSERWVSVPRLLMQPARQRDQLGRELMDHFFMLLFMLLFIIAVPNTKLCARGEEDSGGHVL